MYTLGVRQDLIDLYQELGKEYDLPILLSKKLIAYTGENPNKFKLPGKGCIESVFMGSFDDFESIGLAKFYDNIIENLKEGISILLIHPALESQEMKQITVDHPNFGDVWRSIDAEYFTSSHCKNILKENSIELIDFRNSELINLLDA